MEPASKLIDIIQEDFILLGDFMLALKQVKPFPPMRRIKRTLYLLQASTFDVEVENWHRKSEIEPVETLPSETMNEFARNVLMSVLIDFVEFPFWRVKLCAIAGRGTSTSFYQFRGYVLMFQNLYQQNKFKKLYQGASLYCLSGLIRNLPEISRQSAEDGVLTPFTYSKYSHGQETDYFSRFITLFLTHPLELVTVRMVAIGGEHYSTIANSFKYIYHTDGIRGFFAGLKISSFLALFDSWFLFGIPTLLRTQGMLNTSLKGFGDYSNFIMKILHDQGIFRLLIAGTEAYLYHLIPLCALMGTIKFIFRFLMPSERRKHRRKRRIRYLTYLLSPPEVRRKIVQTNSNLNLLSQKNNNEF